MTTHFLVHHAQPKPQSETLVNVPSRSDTSADAAFAAYVAHHGSHVRRMAALLVGNAHDAEDLAQFALGRALVAWRKHGDLDNPTAYIHRIMVNARTHAWRRKLKMLEVLTDRPPDSLTTSEGAYDVAYDTLDTLLRPLRNLPRTQRIAVVLRYYADFSLEETAEMMGCSAGAVKAYASRGLVAMRHALADQPDIQLNTQRGGHHL